MHDLNDAELAQFFRTRQKKPPRFGLGCLSEAQLAAYVDRQLAAEDREQIQHHLADCGTCRDQVRFLIKVRKTEASETVPIALMLQARGLVRPSEGRTGWRSWQWRAAGALVLCLVLAVVSNLERLKKFSPAQGETGAMSTQRQAEGDGSRGNASNSRALRVIYPSPGLTISRSEAEFRWEPVQGALRYQLRIVTSEGDPVWDQTTEGTFVRFPAGAQMTPGKKYFFSVHADLENGKVARSKAVPFTVVDRK